MTLASAERWFGDKTVPTGTALELCIGPLSVWLSHLAKEWRIAVGCGDDPMHGNASLSQVDPGKEPEMAKVHRFPTDIANNTIRIQPRLADRPVVARPEFPLMIPAGDTADLYVSSPLWIGFELLSPHRALMDLPTHRPSDTWIGSDTLSGQLGYASRTNARLQPDKLPFRPHRAVTPVSIRNRGSDPLEVERLSIPAPNLSLYTNPRGNFWTRTIITTREKNDLPSTVERSHSFAADLGAMEKVAEPREEGTSGVLQRALRNLWG